jgi:CheY-like chemotaxis protein
MPCVRPAPVLWCTGMDIEPATTPQPEAANLRALCVTRHRLLSEHIARYFSGLGIVTTEAVGLESALAMAGSALHDVVICDYDLLATISLETWERDRLLSNIPVIAVSLTRRPQELQLLDITGIAGFLYLPTLDSASALRILRAAAARTKYTLPLNTAPRTVERS